ncbi:hypothetical protein BY996DRAFT_4587431 [Phakopsora pachyrhizi]|uniref:Uncharacterized protein n=1 Tax=Phakopsora pachyrhizi TaxID=170000 RepID=A0AAV0BZ02_PHAPC|nr:hypothetical protein BY996DRAFT_4587431 [Phakopsora pachyrhizi]CAH7690827.1 hypothetical protein PPACK8108_LOCUS26292 [Phakopsora pachyrhizi]
MLKGRKFLVRDWSVWLGWNNVRYTIETGLMLAKILDRELVLPAFTYSNTCEEDIEVCSKLLPKFDYNVPFDLRNVKDRFKYPDPNEGTTVLKPPVPTQNWYGWVIPTQEFLDIDHLLKNLKNNSIKFQDFLKLVDHGEKRSIGMNDGKWSTGYNNGLSYRAIPNEVFNNFSRTIVDRLPTPIKPLISKAMDNGTSNSTDQTDLPIKLIEKCRLTLSRLDSTIPSRRMKRKRMIRRRDVTTNDDKRVPDWDLNLIQGDQMLGELSSKDHSILERCIASNGFRTAYGFTIDGWWMKAPYGPTKYVKRLSKMYGIHDELYNIDEQVLHIQGEIHNGFPPASMLWTTSEGREAYKDLVRRIIRPPEIYEIVAQRLELKVRKLCGGRSWRASHMRRGDFLGYEWTSKDINKQWEKIERGVNESIRLLEAEPDLVKPINKAFNTSLELPRIDDPIYLATNTRLKEELEFLKTKKVILLKDLIDDEDKSLLGVLRSSFMDTLAVLEQCLIMRSAFFFGDAHSSVAGLILNRRVFFGIDERLTKIEYFKIPGDGQ